MTRSPVKDGEQFSAVYWSGMVNAFDEESVVSGCTPSTGTGSWDVDVASGEVSVGRSVVDVSAQTKTLTAPSNDVDLDTGEWRVDLVTIDTTGTALVAEGTAATNPIAPDIPSSEVLVAAVLVSGDATSLSTSDIKDYRIIYNPISPVRVLNESSTFTESDVTVSTTNTAVSLGSIELLGDLNEGWEDGNSTIEGTWTGWSETGTMNLNIQTATVISGSYTAEHEAVGDSTQIDAKNGGGYQTDCDITVRIGSTSGTAGDYLTIRNSSTAENVDLKFDEGTNDVNLNIGGTTVATLLSSFSADTNYAITFDFDYTNGEVSVTINATTYGPYATTFDGHNSLILYHNTTGSGLTRSVYYDDISVYGEKATSGNALIEWASPTDLHSWDLATFQRTLANETVTIDVEDGAGNVLHSDIDENFDISTVADSTNVALRANFSRANTANNPTLDYAARRYVR